MHRLERDPAVEPAVSKALIARRRCKEFVRQTFDGARDDLAEDIRTIIAQQSLTSLESGQTVKRVAAAFENAAAEAVGVCRECADRSKPMREYLPTVVFLEVDRLADQAVDALTQINLMDDHARQRLAAHRDRVLVERTPPADPPSRWSRAKKALEPWTREIVAGSIVAVVGILAARVFSSPPG